MTFATVVEAARRRGRDRDRLPAEGTGRRCRAVLRRGAQPVEVRRSRVRPGDRVIVLAEDGA